MENEKPRIYTITRRQLIESVADRWGHEYREYYGAFPHAVGKLAELKSLDIATCSREAVDEIIGNSTWTRNECDVCGQDVDVVVHLGDKPDYDAQWIDVCPDCLKKAIELVRE